MGFCLFSGGLFVGNVMPLILVEVVERLLYTTVNVLHLDTGNPGFGDVSMILRPGYAQPFALLEPVDTGNWEDSCNVSACPIVCKYLYLVDCVVWFDLV